MVNYEVKGQLAKLLATEDLVIENRQVSTASFDVDKRVLTLPLWERASNVVYDLLVGHEVGHALFTPNEDWTVKYPNVPKSFVNVIEDVRIERLMKQKFPGLARTFFNGYRDLDTQDFFGIEGENLDLLSFVDRINLHYKIGNFSQISFSDDEKPFVIRAYKVNTFDEALQLSSDIAEFLKRKEEDKKTVEVELPNNPKSDTPSQNQTPSPAPTEQSVDGDKGDTQDPEPGWDDEDQPQSSNQGGDQFDTVTDKNLEENIEELSSKQSSSREDPAYVEVPKVNLDTVIVSNEEFYEELDTFYSDTTHQFTVAGLDDPFTSTDAKFNLFKRSAQKEVNYLVKEFECRKAADSYARATTSRTGVLDTANLHTYRYNEDLFKKVTTLAEGKNHGLIFILDWSGSMSNVLLDTYKQLCNLVWFCKKVNIPFDVYAFTNNWYSRDKNIDEYGRFNPPPRHHSREENQFEVESTFNLMNILTSSVRNVEIDRQLKTFWRLVNSIDPQGRYDCAFQWPNSCGLSGTPLNEALITLSTLIPKFQKRHNVQKLQVITLTDGESQGLKYNVVFKPRYEEGEPYLGQRTCMYNTTFIRDRQTGRTYKVENDYHELTTALLRQLRDRFPESNFIGIRVMDGREAGGFVRKYLYWEYDKCAAVMEEWRRNKSLSLTNVGYNKYFGLNSSTLSQTSDFEVQEDATKSQIKSAFKKSLNAKKMNKKVLGEFMQLIA